MITLSQRISRHLVLGILLTTLCPTIIGCEYFPESTFKLANESRLPKWITLPPGLTRAEVSVTMSYYSKPWGGSAKFALQDTKGRLLEKADGKVSCREPFQLKNSLQGSAAGYPSYEAVTVSGVTEIIEQKNMEPIVYITDDPAVWKQYRTIGCGS